MKIDVSKEIAAEIATEVYTATRTAIIKKVLQLEDEALIAQLRTTAQFSYELVHGYLSQTKLHTYETHRGPGVRVENGFLSRSLGLTLFSMKRVREQLLREGLAWTRRVNSRLTITYFPPAAAPRN